MRLQSLGLSSDISLLDAEVLDRGEYLVVRSPKEQGFYWGNLLVFSGPPTAGARPLWEELFAKEFADLPGVLHQTFAWDIGGTTPSLASFVEAGYQQENTVVLTASAVHPPRYPNAQVELRVLSTDAEWADVAELQWQTREPEHEAEGYRNFVQARLAALRSRVNAGQGEWYGAYLGGEQIASLGVFRSGASARFQIVVTAEKARRQGVCGTLVHHASVQALAHPTTEKLIMVADTEYHAARIYESVGFSPAESLVGLCRWPQA
tara:strand:- start:2311 stop:3102 length:792 start_codon:yes stop_codon:yes gene_type:complete